MPEAGAVVEFVIRGVMAAFGGDDRMQPIAYRLLLGFAMDNEPQVRDGKLAGLQHERYGLVTATSSP